MGKKVSQRMRHELIAAVAGRYQRGGRDEKTRILDEFARITGYHRKHAIRLLTGQHMAASLDIDAAMQATKRTRKRAYDEAFVSSLIVFWETADRISGKRLVPLLPLLVSSLKRHGRVVLDDATRTKMLQVSPATVDRLLQPARREAAGGPVRKRTKVYARHRGRRQ